MKPFGGESAHVSAKTFRGEMRSVSTGITAQRANRFGKAAWRQKGPESGIATLCTEIWMAFSAAGHVES